MRKFMSLKNSWFDAYYFFPIERRRMEMELSEV